MGKDGEERKRERARKAAGEQSVPIFSGCLET